MYQFYFWLIGKKLSFYVWIFLSSGHSFAQLPSADNKLVITVAPLSLVDVFDGASLRLGGEVKIHQSVSASVEGGYYLKYLKATKISPEGFLIRPSIKYYLNGQNCSGKYIAVEYQFKDQGFDFRDSIVIGSERFEKQYAMKRVIHSVSFKYGKVKNLGNDFTLEWYGGIGIRYIRSHSDLSPEEEEGILTGEAGDCPIQEDIIRLTGTRIFPNFNCGIKLGYVFH